MSLGVDEEVKLSLYGRKSWLRYWFLKSWSQGFYWKVLSVFHTGRCIEGDKCPGSEPLVRLKENTASGEDWRGTMEIEKIENVGDVIEVIGKKTSGKFKCHREIK